MTRRIKITNLATAVAAACLLVIASQQEAAAQWTSHYNGYSLGINGVGSYGRFEPRGYSYYGYGYGPYGGAYNAYTSPYSSSFSFRYSAPYTTYYGGSPSYRGIRGGIYNPYRARVYSPYGYRGY
jgi:hypothetical protein